MSTFLVLQQELAAQCGLDQTVSSQAVLLKRWLNNAQQIVLRAFEWPFLRSPSPLIIQTVKDYTTGTAGTIAGASSVTFSVALTTSMIGRFIQFSDTKDWYQILSQAGDGLSINIGNASVLAIVTNPVATFTIRKVYYSTSTSVDRIIQVFQDILPYQLIETTPEYFQSFNPGFLSSGTPRIYCMSGVDSTGAPQFRLWPNPDAIINLQIAYFTVATDLSADSDVSVIPAKWHTTVLLEGAKAQAFSFLDDSRYGTSVVLFKDMIEEMKQEYEIGLHRHRVMTSADNQPVGGNLGYMPLPFNYPRDS